MMQIWDIENRKINPLVPKMPARTGQKPTGEIFFKIKEWQKCRKAFDNIQHLSTIFKMLKYSENRFR